MKANVTVDNITNLIKGRGAVISQNVYRISGNQLNELLQTWKQAGIREVVEWIKTHQMPDEPRSEPYPGLVAISKVQMQAKLKEWDYKEE